MAINTSKKQEEKVQIGRLILRYLENEFSYTELMNIASNRDEKEIDDDISIALHTIQHYEDDQDIRQKDNEYELIMREEIISIANKLVRGESLTNEDKFAKPIPIRNFGLLKKILYLFKNNQ